MSVYKTKCNIIKFKNPLSIYTKYHKYKKFLFLNCYEL